MYKFPLVGGGLGLGMMSSFCKVERAGGRGRGEVVRSSVAEVSSGGLQGYSSARLRASNVRITGQKVH